ncbi:MAG: 23S rRNA (uracil(1939)-C(5))-methyltransferase, partial [Gammaproteobacteria bacterium]|nr:23S rRNA (uracil(1939)-C(5))-methyltransferase [Gammaproteobacteria bacterium]NNJ73115.1 23S rRNA (uracil(1939)-C(5))-methyltransferase [Enterobacterales bacterium]
MGRRRRIKLPKEPVAVEIQSLGHDGRGIGQLASGKTIFVDMALPGETALAEYTYKRSKFDEARAIEITNPAAERVTPPCAHFGICGGCSLQHLSTAGQIEHKQVQLFELLDHNLGHSDYEHMPALTDEVRKYRRKARLGVKYVHKKQTALIGFREKRNSFIADITDCEILDDRVAKLLMPLRELISNLQIRERMPQIEVACGDDQVALVFRH